MDESRRVKRVLVLYDGMRVSGPAKGLLQLARDLSGYGIEYEMITFSYTARENRFFSALQERGIRSRLMPGNVAALGAHFGELVTIAQSCDFIQSHGYKTHLLALAISARLSIPWVAVEHGFTAENVKSRCFQLLGFLAAACASKIVVTSPQLKRRIGIIRRPSRQPKFIPNAVDLGEVPVTSERKEIRERFLAGGCSTLLGVFGRLSPEKGQALLIAAVARHELLRERCALIVAGEGPEERRLKVLAARLGIAEKVHFVGYQDRIGDWLSAMDVVVLPSLSEGLPNVLLEALVLGQPVVATDVGAVSVVLNRDEFGLLCPANDVRKLTEACIYAVQHLEEMRLRAMHGSKHVLSRYTPALRAERFAALYRSA